MHDTLISLGTDVEELVYTVKLRSGAEPSLFHDLRFAIAELVENLSRQTMVASEIAHYDHPGGVGSYAFERGNVQTLPGGNVFITWTLSAQHSEYTADGTLIAEAKFLTPLKTYRSVRDEQ